MTFTVGTPRVGVPLTAMLADPDGGETGHEWQWMVVVAEEDAVKTDYRRCNVGDLHSPRQRSWPSYSALR